MKTNLLAPRWNLNSLYSSFKGKDYLAALKSVDTQTKQMEDVLKLVTKPFKSATTFSKWLYDFLPSYNNLFALYESLSAYAYLVYSTDTTNPENLNNISLIDEKGLLIRNIDMHFRKVLSENASFLSSFFKTYPQCKNYKYIFEQEVIAKKHEMTPLEENLAQDLQRYGGDSWSRLHEQIISNLIDEKTGKTFNTLRNDAYDANRKNRKTAWEKEIALLKQNEIAIAACLNNIKGSTVCLNKRRSWSSALSKAMFSSNLSEKTLNALIASIEKSLPFWRKYLNVKAKALKVEKCAFYDLFAPLPSTKRAEKTWTFPQARDYIIEKFSSFSEDMGNFAKMAFEKNWIDAEVRKGKVGGAYCQDFPVQKESRVLSNFTGTFSDVTTLAHELGHAYHHWCIKDMDYCQTQYPMTLAETASIFAETIVMKDIISQTSGYERAKLIEMRLSDSCQVLVDILCRFYFERSVFEQRQKNELSAEDFCKLMADAQQKSYGSGLSDERHPYMWAVKSHYYSPDLDFYNFPYAFGLLFGTGLYARYTKEGKDFPPIYKQILQNTGIHSCEDVCKQAGFDIQNTDFWTSSINSFKSELTELTKYVDSIQ